MDFKITTIKKHHKNQIYKLIQEINAADKLHYSITEDWLDYMIDHSGQSIFVAFHKDQLLGLATVMINTVYQDQAALNIIVAPAYRNKGLAGMLYNKMEDFIKGNNIKILETYVKQRLVDGVSFAQKRGFTTTMYSWEMELDLGKRDFAFEELPGLNFRQANHQDGGHYKKIIQDAFGDQVGEDALIQSLKDSSIRIYFLEKENQIIGSATIQLRKDLSLAYVYDIGVLKDYRGQGLGSYLLKASIRSLKEKDLEKISLLVTGENTKALNLYKKIGFKQADVDLIMTKRVE